MVEAKTRGRRVAVLLAVVLTVGAIDAIARPEGVSGNVTSRLVTTELSKALDWSSGEAWVVANPRNPLLLTADWTSFPYKSPAAALDAPGPHPVQCGVARSTDGGTTWVEGTLPFQRVAIPFNPGGCADPTLAEDSRGTVYALFNGGSLIPGAGTTKPRLPSLASLSVSRDDGRTWSAPTKVWSFDDAPRDTVATESPDAAFDRPWLVIDPVTSTMYASLSDDALVERVVMASHDHGVTWGVPYPLDPNGQTVWADVISAANGVLAAAYDFDPNSITGIVSAAPAVKCAGVCAVFETSSNDGKTWIRTVLPIHGLSAASGRIPTGPGLEVAADPSIPARYAVLIPRSSSALEIWVTPDSGSSWTRTLTINAGDGDRLAKPWIAFGPRGTLGISWRAVHRNNSSEVYATVSTNDGATFRPDVELTPGPAAPDIAPEAPGDDCACNLFLDNKYLYVTWADSRTGQRQVWFARYRY